MTVDFDRVIKNDRWVWTTFVTHRGHGTRSALRREGLRASATVILHQALRLAEVRHGVTCDGAVDGRSLGGKRQTVRSIVSARHNEDTARGVVGAVTLVALAHCRVHKRLSDGASWVLVSFDTAAALTVAHLAQQTLVALILSCAQTLAVQRTSPVELAIA